MRFDWRLCRLLLLQIESTPENKETETALLKELSLWNDLEKKLAKYSETQRIYHIALLIEGGLVNGQVVKDHTGNHKGAAIQHLTVAGHQMADWLRCSMIAPIKIFFLKNLLGFKVGLKIFGAFPDLGKIIK